MRRLAATALLVLASIFCLTLNASAQLTQTGAGAGHPGPAAPFTGTTFNLSMAIR